MAFLGNHPIYDALPISNDALDKGGVELLRAAIVDEKLFVMARLDAFVGQASWGLVLADIARRLASLYAAEGDLTEARVTAAIVEGFEFSFRRLGVSTARNPDQSARKGREGAKPAKSARPRVKRPVAPRAKSKPSTKASARRKGARPKP
jgi:Domain of unknown function (DUF5076)